MAINFPATAGQPTNGSYTYTVAGITYSWDGSSWTAAGAGASATDTTLFSVTTNSAGTPALSYNNTNGVFSYTPPDLSTYLTAETDTLDTVTGRGATTTNNIEVAKIHANGALATGSVAGTPSTGKYVSVESAGSGVYHQMVLKSVSGGGSLDMLTIEPNGATPTITTTYKFTCGELLAGATNVTSLTAGGLTYPTSNGSSGDVLTSDGAGNVTWQAASGLQTRKTVAVSQSIANNGVANVSLSTAKTMALMQIETSHAAWVTLYSSTTARTADAGRAETTDPTPGSGVLAEVITAGQAVQLITPASVCFNESGTATTYAKIVNKSGSTANVQVTLTYLQLEV